mgnify:FL=1
MIVLPTERKKAENYNPSLLVLFGKPKSGKSTLMAALDSNLIIDLENGYRALSVMDIQVRSAEELFQAKALIEAKMKKEGAFPYRFITIDNATRLEEMSLPYAARLYRNTAMGQSWGKVKDPKTGKFEIDPKADVRLLPNGAGYLYLRQAIRKMIDMFKPLCETLILVAHVKDKQIKKDGEEMSEMSVDLAGKLGDIICGEADAIGYIYREKNNTLISFEGGDNTIREARPLHLRGKKFVVATSDEDNHIKVDMSKIFV